MDKAICPNYVDGTCSVVANLSGCDKSLCMVSEDACAACLGAKSPRQRNYVTASLAIATANRHLSPEAAAKVKFDLKHDIPIEKRADAPAGGPGTELKKVLGWLGFKPSTGCSCGSHQREMDRRGVDWCSANIETIVGWLAEEAKAQSLPFFEMPARALIRYAIRRANK